MRGKLEGIREGVSPWGGRPSKVKRTVNVLCQQNNLLRMKPGLKSYLLSRLFPTVCSGELHSCGAGEGRRGGRVPPGGTYGALRVSFLALAPWRAAPFSGNGRLRALGGGCQGEAHLAL